MLSTEQIVLRLTVATALGAVVGLERERLERAAGLRTHALVGVGAALFMIVSAFGFDDALAVANVTLDPSRVAAQVVSGIGFLGAGTIIFQREIVRGLTTAASIWAVAAIGLAAGSGLFVAAVAATALVLLVLAGLKPIENRFFLHRRLRLLTLAIDRRTASLYAIESAVAAAGLRLERLLIEQGPTEDEDRLDLVLSRPRAEALDALIDQLRRLPGVRRISSVRQPAGLASETYASGVGESEPAIPQQPY
jgi:putative Mg2+ transporter-C (MgtC) family protein